jgi:alpha-D-xyloside xylohydrolase
MFKNQIPAATNFCVTGEPYWTYDIGAFFVKNREQWFWSGDFDAGCADAEYREFYLRMFQCGAFLPMFRSHGTDCPREVWQFGQPGDVIYDTLVRFIRLRYQLLPYFYSLAGQVTHTGMYWLAPLGMIFPQDAEAREIKQAFMVGPSFLVWPVTDPLASLDNGDYRVYLPAGGDWYDFWTGHRYSGGQWLTIPVTLASIPVFVGGDNLPLISQTEIDTCQSTDDLTFRMLDMLIYPGQNAVFDLYEDEGDNYSYESGACAWTRFIWQDQASNLTRQISGGYPGYPNDKIIRAFIVSDDQTHLEIQQG